MTTDEATASALAQARAQLKESARVHKRTANAHRRSLREVLQALERLETRCRDLGIELDLDDEAKEARSHAG